MAKSDELAEAMAKDPNLADIWKKMDDAELDTDLVNDPEVLEALKKIDCN